MEEQPVAGVALSPGEKMREIHQQRKVDNLLDTIDLNSLDFENGV